MDVTYLAVVAALAMTGLAFVILAALSARNLFNGKHSVFTMLSFLVPVVVFGVSWALNIGAIDRAAVLAAIIMFALGFLAILLSGLKSMFG